VTSIFNVSSPLVEGSQDTNGCMKICFPPRSCYRLHSRELCLPRRNADSDSTVSASDVSYHGLNSHVTAFRFCMWKTMPARYTLPPSSTYQTTRCHVEEDQNSNFYGNEIKSDEIGEQCSMHDDILVARGFPKREGGRQFAYGLRRSS
jgi:hypothetical protein